MSDATPGNPHVGLCATCHHKREIVSGKGSRFLYCVRAETDARYRKYPPLPVLRCPGYEPFASSSSPG
ncbi:MAG: hypothetical protein HOP18_12200 [Deltaproteobacteria bacterium]|nr:hypothetical protein [Deltaproteobacteria bacterium]